ncbi:phosphoribosylformylglycinamidine cyclo-ligase [Rubrivirga sp. S365]|nr:phosphoribosylformylglycinamidine cyclo-ligase [Rubrivirga sp. S365]MDT7857504.1 phosphoribosylformylglycinamidine cyclo-ligase [Rubrivirga sp. S365]
MATYKEAGVDIDAGEEAVRRISDHVRGTFTPGVLTDVGAFGGLFALAQEGVRDPVLVSSMDGVGTKLKVAQRVDRHETVGEDLVNHCVNDIAVCGARPLFFLDYFAAGVLKPDVVEAVVKGFAKACRENGCALIGGETAEMPDLYKAGDYDLAGTVVGVVERDAIVDGSAIEAGDVLLGLPSTGLHTNGYSLARKVLFDRFVAADTPDVLGGVTVGEALLRVHKSYLDAIQALIAEGLAHGFAHVTGGGLVGNTERVLPDSLALDVDWDAWSRPALFRLIQETGEVPEDDMRRTFNLGVGLVAVVPSDARARALAVLGALGEPAFEIGRVVEGSR